MTFRGTRHFESPTLPELRRELDRFAEALHGQFAEQARGMPRRWTMLPVVYGNADAQYDAVLPIDSAGATVVRLPKPDPRNTGRELAVLRLRPPVAGTFLANGGFVDGGATAILPAFVGLFVVFFDGSNHWRLRGAT